MSKWERWIVVDLLRVFLSSFSSCIGDLYSHSRRSKTHTHTIQFSVYFSRIIMGLEFHAKILYVWIVWMCPNNQSQFNGDLVAGWFRLYRYGNIQKASATATPKRLATRGTRIRIMAVIRAAKERCSTISMQRSRVCVLVSAFCVLCDAPARRRLFDWLIMMLCVRCACASPCSNVARIQNKRTHMQAHSKKSLNWFAHKRIGENVRTCERATGVRHASVQRGNGEAIPIDTIRTVQHANRTPCAHGNMLIVTDQLQLYRRASSLRILYLLKHSLRCGAGKLSCSNIFVRTDTMLCVFALILYTLVFSAITYVWSIHASIHPYMRVGSTYRWNQNATNFLYDVDSQAPDGLQITRNVLNTLCTSSFQKFECERPRIADASRVEWSLDFCSICTQKRHDLLRVYSRTEHYQIACITK